MISGTLPRLQNWFHFLSRFHRSWVKPKWVCSLASPFCIRKKSSFPLKNRLRKLKVLKFEHQFSSGSRIKVLMATLSATNQPIKHFLVQFKGLGGKILEFCDLFLWRKLLYSVHNLYGSIIIVGLPAYEWANSNLNSKPILNTGMSRYKIHKWKMICYVHVCVWYACRPMYVSCMKLVGRLCGCR